MSHMHKGVGLWLHVVFICVTHLNALNRRNVVRTLTKTHTTHMTMTQHTLFILIDNSKFN